MDRQKLEHARQARAIHRVTLGIVDQVQKPPTLRLSVLVTLGLTALVAAWIAVTGGTLEDVLLGGAIVTVAIGGSFALYLLSMHTWRREPLALGGFSRVEGGAEALRLSLDWLDTHWEASTRLAFCRPLPMQWPPAAITGIAAVGARRVLALWHPGRHGGLFALVTGGDVRTHGVESDGRHARFTESGVELFVPRAPRSAFTLDAVMRHYDAACAAPPATPSLANAALHVLPEGVRKNREGGTTLRQRGAAMLEVLGTAALTALCCWGTIMWAIAASEPLALRVVLGPLTALIALASARYTVERARDLSRRPQPIVGRPALVEVAVRYARSEHLEMHMTVEGRTFTVPALLYYALDRAREYRFYVRADRVLSVEDP